MILEAPATRQSKYRRSVKGKNSKANWQRTEKGKAALSRAGATYRLRKAGVSEDEISRARVALNIFLLSDQVCPIFNVPTTQVGGHAVDHNQDTKRFRGIISKRANVILGLARDNPLLLRRLADYLEQNP